MLLRANVAYLGDGRVSGSRKYRNRVCATVTLLTDMSGKMGGKAALPADRYRVTVTFDPSVRIPQTSAASRGLRLMQP